MIFLTDNSVLVDNIRSVLPIQCEQKKAAKKVPDEKDFIKANALGFGDDIGPVTNRITAQTELQSLFGPGTPEYEELQYRITAGQHVQQNCIDKMKGVVAKPMPKHWYNENAARNTGNPADISICASKKPYFMIWRYPQLKSQYDAFQKNVGRRCIVDFGLTLDELDALENLTDEQKNFLYWRDKLSPVQHSCGVMNRICTVCEKYFAKHKINEEKREFDPSILKSNVGYSRYTRKKIETLFHDFTAKRQSLKQITLTDEDFVMRNLILQTEFQEACAVICPNEDELCDIVVDVCYSNERSKQFAWDMCGERMLCNLLNANDGMVTYYQAAKYGEVLYCGKRFSQKQLCIKDTNNEGNYIERREAGGRVNHLWRRFG